MNTDEISYEECINTINSMALLRNVTDDTDDEPSFILTKEQVQIVTSVINRIDIDISYPLICFGPNGSVVLQFTDDNVGLMRFFINRDSTICAILQYNDDTCSKQIVSFTSMMQMIGIFTHD